MAKRYSKSFTEKKLTYLTKHLEKYSIMKKKKYRKYKSRMTI